jgi:hypothetical protein
LSHVSPPFVYIGTLCAFLNALLLIGRLWETQAFRATMGP